MWVERHSLLSVIVGKRWAYLKKSCYWNLKWVWTVGGNHRLHLSLQKNYQKRKEIVILRCCNQKSRSTILPSSWPWILRINQHQPTKKNKQTKQTKHFVNGKKELWTENVRFVSNCTVVIDGSGAVLVDLIDDAVQLFVCQLVVQFVEEIAQNLNGEVSVSCANSSTIKTTVRSYTSRGICFFLAFFARTFFIEEAEGFCEFLLHLFHVFLNEELGGQGTELVELQLAGTCAFWCRYRTSTNNRNRNTLTTRTTKAQHRKSTGPKGNSDGATLADQRGTHRQRRPPRWCAWGLCPWLSGPWWWKWCRPCRSRSSPCPPDRSCRRFCATLRRARTAKRETKTDNEVNKRRLKEKRVRSVASWGGEGFALFAGTYWLFDLHRGRWQTVRGNHKGTNRENDDHCAPMMIRFYLRNGYFFQGKSMSRAFKDTPATTRTKRRPNLRKTESGVFLGQSIKRKTSRWCRRGRSKKVSASVFCCWFEINETWRLETPREDVTLSVLPWLHFVEE